MASEASNTFMGTGWSFPPSFSQTTGEVEMISDEEDIRSSLDILLSTRLGERVMLPDYGCNLDDLLFEPINLTLKTYIQDLVRTAILYYEPRIRMDKLDMSETNEPEGLIVIHITYTLKSTNSRFNYVYPYYKNEGSNI